MHLLDHGAHIDAKDCDGKTALSWAARNGKLEVVQHLIKQGADKEAEDNDGRTAIMHAANAGRLDVMQYLIEQRADIWCLDMQGNSMLQHLVASTARSNWLSWLISTAPTEEDILPVA